MGKANKVKVELRDAVEMVDLIQTLKDIADNKYYSLINKKDKFRRFGETFIEFFRMISLTKANTPIIGNNNPKVGIIVVTVEGSFLGEFNNKIVRKAIEEQKKYGDAEFIAVGNRSVEQLQRISSNVKIYEDMETRGFYETAIKVKDYVFEKVLSGELGKVIVAYSWPKNFETQKPRIIKLLPCDELVDKQIQYTDYIEDVIEESDPVDVINFLADLWVTTRLYEMFMDCVISSAAHQSSFLEDSVDRLKKIKKQTLLKYRKAKKNDIDKSLRETFTARMITMQKT